MNNTLKVSASPHERSSLTTRTIMMLVAAALAPACLVGILTGGVHVILVIAVSVASSVFFEYIYEKLMKKPVTIGDFSAVVTGLLIAMNMPPNIVWWVPVLGAAFGILIVKQLYGGLGQNFMNPALGARCFLLISFAGRMTDFTPTKGLLSVTTEVASTTDALSGATPLAYLKTGAHFDLKALFLGTVQGTIGETSALALLVGGIFLVVMGIISLRIPGTYLGTFAILTFVTAGIRGYSNPFVFTLEELCAGGIMLGAWFMATDYVTSPITPKGQLVYGTLLGVLTWIFRMIGTSSEGVSYAIIFMNLLVPMIEHYTMPLAFGIRKEKASGKGARS